MKIFFQIILYFSIFYNKNNHIAKIYFCNFYFVKYYVIELQFKIYTIKNKLTTMAEIIENKMDHHDVPSMAKANAGLTLG